MLRTVTAILTILLLAQPAFGGTAGNPEIHDDVTDSALLTGAVIPHLEITKGWVQPSSDRFHFIMQVAALDTVPADAVYVFHYSFGGLRLYYRAEWDDQIQDVKFSGGIYEGVKGTNAYDPQGNRNYVYIAGPANQTERMDGKITPGAPARIEWSYPMDSFGEDRRNLEFKGMFITAYQKRAHPNGGMYLQHIDVGITEEDYVHKLYQPWWSKFVPGPSPLLVIVAVAGVLVAAGRNLRRSR